MTVNFVNIETAPQLQKRVFLSLNLEQCDIKPFNAFLRSNKIVLQKFELSLNSVRKRWQSAGNDPFSDIWIWQKIKSLSYFWGVSCKIDQHVINSLTTWHNTEARIPHVLTQCLESGLEIGIELKKALAEVKKAGSMNAVSHHFCLHFSPNF